MFVLITAILGQKFPSKTDYNNVDRTSTLWGISSNTSLYAKKDQKG